eukprot:15354945-Alexandrium_andersonii.AAC.1
MGGHRALSSGGVKRRRARGLRGAAVAPLHHLRWPSSRDRWQSPPGGSAMQSGVRNASRAM